MSAAHGTQPGWWHDTSRELWQYRDHRGQPVRSVTDELIDALSIGPPPGARS